MANAKSTPRKTFRSYRRLCLWSCVPVLLLSVTSIRLDSFQPLDIVGLISTPSHARPVQASYTELAEEAEAVTVELGADALMARFDDETQFYPVDESARIASDSGKKRTWKEESVPAATGECGLCRKLLWPSWIGRLFGRKKSYNYRKPFDLSKKPDILKATSSLLDEAESEDIESVDGSIRASTVRLVLNAAMPEADLLCRECPLFRAIVAQNIHLRKMYSSSRRYDPPIATPNLLKCPQFISPTNRKAASELEEIFPHSRNLDFVELQQLKSMTPYIVLPSLPSFARQVDDSGRAQFRRSILVDVGANDFYGSPKNLIDAYLPFQPFTDIHLFDIKPIQVPDYYSKHFNITVHSEGVRVGTRDEKDVITWLREHVTVDDFVVLKFDVDYGTSGPTMEWGFLADLLYSKELELVDEFYTELHFWYPEIGWKHKQHSMQQAYDVFRQLRSCGLPVHSWP